MAKASSELISAVRETADFLQSSNLYQWGHMGACNCGFLAQRVTRLRKEDIHARAMRGHGNWSEQLNDYCPTSGRPMDDLISDLLAFGFSVEDLQHLERLSDPEVLKAMPPGLKYPRHNVKADVVAYLRVWAQTLEDRLLQSITLPAWDTADKIHRPEAMPVI
jgi:hypothetical protein